MKDVLGNSLLKYWVPFSKEGKHDSPMYEQQLFSRRGQSQERSTYQLMPEYWLILTGLSVGMLDPPHGHHRGHVVVRLCDT